MEGRKEEYKWLFIGEIPLLFPSRSLAKQFAIEFWLNPNPILEGFHLDFISPIEDKQPWKEYIT